MALYTTEVLVIGVKNWGNADKIVTLLSPEYGKITAAAYGCRRPKSPLASSMQLFSWLDVQLSRGERMDTIRQCEHKGFFADLYEDLTAMAYGSFIAEFAKELCSEDEPQAEIYQTLLKILPCLTKNNPRICAVASAYQIFEYTGCQLHYDKCTLCGAKITGDAYFNPQQGGVLCDECSGYKAHNFSASLREFITNMLLLNWDNPPKFQVKGADLVAAEQILLNYIQGLIGKPFKSLAFIKQVTQLNNMAKNIKR